MNIFSYWEGPLPEYIDVCLKSIRKACGDDFVLVEPETVDVWLNGHLHRNWKLLGQPALRADAIRAALLAVHGGWWLDADTVLFKHPQEVNETFPGEVLYMTWNRPPKRVLNGYIFMARGCRASLRWLERVNDTLARDPEKIDWTDIGEKAITSDLTDDPNAREIPRQLFLPIDIDSNVKAFFSTENPSRFIDHRSTVAFGLNHSWFMYHKSNEMTLPKSRWAESNLLIHKLLAGASR
jgi:hypothetical protein